MEVENGPQKETKVIFQAPIFHFHDYGRKGILYPLKIDGGFRWLISILRMVNENCFQEIDSFPDDSFQEIDENFQRIKNITWILRGVVIPWVVPLPSNSGKWRFRLGFPTKNGS